MEEMLLLLLLLLARWVPCNATEALHCCLAQGGVACLLLPRPMSSPPLPLHLSKRLNVTVLVLIV